MKTSVCIIALSTLLTGLALTGCRSSEEKIEDAKEKVQEAFIDLSKAEKDYHDQTDKFRIEAEAKLSANEKRISELKENTKNIKEKIREDYVAQLEKLEEKNTTLKNKIVTNKEEDRTKWESFKLEFSHDMDELGKALKDLTKNNIK